jgi:hypothetical protein
MFPSYRKYDPGCSSRPGSRILIFLPILDPGSRGQRGAGPRFRIRNTEEWHWPPSTVYRDKWNHTRVDVAEVHQGQIQGGQKTGGRPARRVTHVQSHLEIGGQIITALLMSHKQITKLRGYWLGWSD